MLFPFGKCRNCGSKRISKSANHSQVTEGCQGQSYYTLNLWSSFTFLTYDYVIIQSIQWQEGQSLKNAYFRMPGLHSSLSWKTVDSKWEEVRPAPVSANDWLCGLRQVTLLHCLHLWSDESQLIISRQYFPNLVPIIREGCPLRLCTWRCTICRCMLKVSWGLAWRNLLIWHF